MTTMKKNKRQLTPQTLSESELKQLAESLAPYIIQILSDHLLAISGCDQERAGEKTATGPE